MFDDSLAEKRRNEAELVAAIAKGDEAALERFYRDYFSQLYRFVFYRVARDHHHAEEVVHDTFMEALDKADEYSPDRGSVEAWLITLSRNRIRALNTKMNRPHEYEKSWSMVDGDLENIFADLSREARPDARLESEQLRDLVGSTLSSLPADYSKLLEMKYVSNLPVREIAGVLEKTEKAVESQLVRARTAFREAFLSVASGPAAELGL